MNSIRALALVLAMTLAIWVRPAVTADPQGEVSYYYTAPFEDIRLKAE